jgi:hypothetical protein
MFEVKLKRSSDEIDKQQIDYSESDRRRLTKDAMECLESALADQDLDTPVEFEATLTTAFDRVTMVARDGSGRLTCDFGVCLIGRAGDSVQMQRELILLETKSEDGHSPADRELERMSVPTISLSKYRVGMSLVDRGERSGPQPALWHRSDPQADCVIESRPASLRAAIGAGGGRRHILFVVKASTSYRPWIGS